MMTKMWTKVQIDRKRGSMIPLLYLMLSFATMISLCGLVLILRQQLYPQNYFPREWFKNVYRQKIYTEYNRKFMIVLTVSTWSPILQFYFCNVPPMVLERENEYDIARYWCFRQKNLGLVPSSSFPSPHIVEIRSTFPTRMWTLLDLDQSTPFFSCSIKRQEDGGL